ncbi:hypothetical protein HaLaN_26247 [Haematococcus lacustris]|uniref:Uncharacterized protein n=1 Tax=Haematococcus lacustris TaxID=44745 RepID=A0A6A0A5S6_HAELA|nr:hypothetical protein HaLaN_26247 [Haematococcus lacustris]
MGDASEASCIRLHAWCAAHRHTALARVGHQCCPQPSTVSLGWWQPMGTGQGPVQPAPGNPHPPPTPAPPATHGRGCDTSRRPVTISHDDSWPCHQGGVRAEPAPPSTWEARGKSAAGQQSTRAVPVAPWIRGGEGGCAHRHADGRTSRGGHVQRVVPGGAGGGAAAVAAWQQW